jgi:hypothetical protein
MTLLSGISADAPVDDRHGRQRKITMIHGGNGESTAGGLAFENPRIWFSRHDCAPFGS